MTSPTPQQGSPGDTTRPLSSLSALPVVPRPEFQTVPAGGYHKSQVDSWINKAAERIIALEHAIETGAGHALHVVSQVEANPKSRQLTEDLMRIALDEITGMRTQAAADIAQMMNDARQQAAATIEQAHAEATQTVNGAHEQANSLLADARDTAKQRLDEATAQAAAVSEGAQRRMEAVVSIHKESVNRMREIAQVAAGLVGAEDERGSLEDEVQRIVVPQQPQPSGPQPRIPAGRRTTGQQAAAG